MFGGPHDGEIVAVAGPYSPVPDVLRFGEVQDVTGLDMSAMERLVITSVRYRRRLGPRPRCCASWCTFPRPCSCCPRCGSVPLAYDLERP